MPARKSFLRDVWRLIKPYWTSEERFTAWLLLAAVIGLTLAMVYMEVQFNYWHNDFYNSLQEKDKAAFWKLMGRFAILASIFIALAVYAFYLNQMLQIRWRRWLTDVYLKQWLSDHAYYRLQLRGNPADNPDQRIAEDFKLFVDESLTLSLGFLNAVVTLVTFVGILWGLSGPLAIPFNGGEIIIPGYMVWAALLYAIAGTWITHKIGKALIGLSFNQQRFEADFRFSLVRFRENAEGVALYAGEQDELRTFRQRFANVVENWWRIMKRQKILNSFTIGYSQAAVIFPFLVAGNRYFAGAIQLGGLMQISNAFGQVQGSLSWFISAYSTFASWKATCDRLLGFRDAMENARLQQEQEGVKLVEEDSKDLSIDNIVLNLPNGSPLLEASKISIAPQDSVLIQGPSGSGKSTLFRAFAGIWPFGSGRIHMPKGIARLFLPQKPYLPLGTLRDVVSYPARDVSSQPDETLVEALNAVGLPHLAGRLDEQHDWALLLSPGEQQRIAFARALLQKPDWLFMDEATSALDDANEERLFKLLKERLPRTTIVSVGHRSALIEHHSRRLELRDGADGTRTLVAT